MDSIIANYQQYCGCFFEINVILIRLKKDVIVKVIITTAFSRCSKLPLYLMEKVNKMVYVYDL